MYVQMYRFWTLLGRSWENLPFKSQKLNFGHPPRIGKICIKTNGFWTLLGRSLENLLFGSKKLILASLLELPKFKSKSNDSGHFWADPVKICFLNPKTEFWPASQNLQNSLQNLWILRTFGPIMGKSAFCTQKLHFGHPPGICKFYIKIYRFWTLLGRSWENLLFGFKSWILTNHPESDRSCLLL